MKRIREIFVSGFRLPLGFARGKQASGFKPAACSLRHATICSILFLSAVWTPCYSQDDNKLVTLSKQIMDAKSNAELYAPFEELKGLYFKGNKYTEFIEFLRSLGAKKTSLEPFANYYIALTRYSQLKYLEENQIWDEYFASGNEYRDELDRCVQKVIDTTTPDDKLNIYARLLIFQFHKDQQDSFAARALEDLMSACLEYSKSTDDSQPIKEIADILFSYEEKAKSRQLYKIYTEKLAASSLKDEELKTAAAQFFKQENLELAESIYDLYLDRISKTVAKENLIPVLIGLAEDFSYKDDGANDPFYAEKLFSKIEELAGKEAFNEELIYLRAFNLEKSKEYAKAKDKFLDLIKTFPATTHADEALFKAGLITAYVLRNKEEGRTYFERLLAKEGKMSPQGLSSLYQLGLLSQWEGDFDKAKTYYNKMIAQAGGDPPEIVVLAKMRLKEIEEARPIEYNLKTFLEATFKEEYAMLDMAKIDLKSHPYKVKKEYAVSVSSSVYVGETGCMQVELEYLWSGQLGKQTPASGQSMFNTSYSSSGTKEINLVVISPSGIIDRSIDMVDIY
jgi:TolA-binding protein